MKKPKETKANTRLRKSNPKKPKQQPRKSLSKKQESQKTIESENSLIISEDMKIGMCLLMLRISDIISDFGKEKALNHIQFQIRDAEETISSDTWGVAKFLHESIMNEVKQIQRRNNERKN